MERAPTVSYFCTTSLKHSPPTHVRDVFQGIIKWASGKRASELNRRGLLTCQVLSTTCSISMSHVVQWLIFIFYLPVCLLPFSCIAVGGAGEKCTSGRKERGAAAVCEVVGNQFRQQDFRHPKLLLYG